MDTLDKIRKTHKLPIHLRPRKGEFETVIVTKYPHGYDVAHVYICDSLDDAFGKATNSPLSFSVTPYEWRIYDWEKKAIAQSPNLHLCWPEDSEQWGNKVLELQNELAAVTRDRDEWRDSCKLANQRIDTTARAEKENFKLRKMLQAIVDYSTPMELKRLIGEAAKMLKEMAKHA